MSHHTFTYRHSDLPAVRPEITAEIIAIGLHADDLILKSHGNYRELEELAETLNNSLNTCELNLNSIRIIPDDSPQPTTVSMQDLPIEQKQLIFECARTNSILLNLLSEIVGQSCEELARDIAIQASIHQKTVEQNEIENFINDVMMPLAQQSKEQPPAKGLYVFKQL
ncbi:MULTISPECIES: hypothetical protein [unclassified Microcoleus]|uniref:hypothetical protein n=1 Tax=unclassified Microcoleus TaxID=2642155 RepID=UPI002FD0911E